MDFQLDIGELTNGGNEYGNLINTLSEIKANINNTVYELSELGWSGESRDKFEQIHKQKQEIYTKLEEDFQYMKNALEYEIKPKAIQLKKRSEDFVNCIKRGGSGLALTSDDTGVISLQYGGQFKVNNNISDCDSDYFKKMNSKFEEILGLTNKLKFTSFCLMGDIANAENLVQNQTTSLTEFDNSFNIYCSGVKEIESNTCSVFGKISGITAGISNYRNSCVLDSNGSVDKNKLKQLRAKNPDDLTEEEKQWLQYIDDLGEGNCKTAIPVLTVDTSKFTRDGRNRIEYLYMQLESIEEHHGLYDTMGIIKFEDYDEAVNETWDEIYEIIEDESKPETKAIAEVDGRVDSVVSGSIQAFGGWTEAQLGKGIAVTGVGTVNPLAIGGGTYLMLDGTSNMSGGGSKVYNAIKGNNEGDKLNFMKNAYIEMSPKYGENIYNMTEVIAGCYSIGQDIKGIQTDSVRIFPRTKNIARAESDGLQASTSVLNIDNQIVITTKTDDGMILQRTVIDKGKDMSSYQKAGLASDVYNTDSSAESLN